MGPALRALMALANPLGLLLIQLKDPKKKGSSTKSTTQSQTHRSRQTIRPLYRFYVLVDQFSERPSQLLQLVIFLVDDGCMVLEDGCSGVIMVTPCPVGFGFYGLP